MDLIKEAEINSDKDYEVNAMTSKQPKIDGDNLATVSKKEKTCPTNKSSMRKRRVPEKKISMDASDEADIDSDEDSEVNAMTQKLQKTDSDNLATASKKRKLKKKKQVAKKKIQMDESDTDADEDNKVNAMPSNPQEIDDDNLATVPEHEDREIVLPRYVISELVLQIIKLKSGIPVDPEFRNNLRQILGTQNVNGQRINLDIAEMAKKNKENDAAFLERVKNGEELGFRGFEEHEMYNSDNFDFSNEQEPKQDEGDSIPQREQVECD